MVRVEQQDTTLIFADAVVSSANNCREQDGVICSQISIGSPIRENRLIEQLCFENFYIYIRQVIQNKSHVDFKGIEKMGSHSQLNQL